MTARLCTPATLMDLLRDAPDGLTADELSAAAGYSKRGGAMPMIRDCWALHLCHIDRWSGPIRGQYAAVWMAGEGEDCPSPERGN